MTANGKINLVLDSRRTLEASPLAYGLCLRVATLFVLIATGIACLLGGGTAARAATITKGPVVRSGANQCNEGGCIFCCDFAPDSLRVQCSNTFDLDFVPTTTDVIVIVENTSFESFGVSGWSGDLCGVLPPVFEAKAFLVFLMRDLRIGSTQTFSLLGEQNTACVRRSVEIGIYEYMPPATPTEEAIPSKATEMPYPTTAIGREHIALAPDTDGVLAPTCAWQCPSCSEIPYSSWILDFGVVDTGSSAELSATVQNCGVETITGVFPPLRGSAFSLVGSPRYRLAPGASRTFVFRFQPRVEDVSARIVALPCSDQSVCDSYENQNCLLLFGQGVGAESGTKPADAEVSSRSRVIDVTPNPLATMGTIQYRLAKSSNVRIQIYDVAGRRIRSLVNGHVQRGLHEVVWDRTAENGTRVAEGVYYVVVTTPSQSFTRPVVVVR